MKARNKRRSTPKRNGFTLLEVILALIILAGAVAVLGELNRMALRNAADARDLSQAQFLAESKMAELRIGKTVAESADNVPFDADDEHLNKNGPPWVYSIGTQSNDEPGLITVRLTVTRDQPANQHPVKYTLVEFLPDPNYTYTPPVPTNGNATAGGS